MKKITEEEFNSIKKKGGRPLNQHSIKARELICEFVESGEDIMEIEPSDFDNAFDFKDIKQRNQAAVYLRNNLRINTFSRSRLNIAVINDRIFIKYK